MEPPEPMAAPPRKSLANGVGPRTKGDMSPSPTSAHLSLAPNDADASPPAHTGTAEEPPAKRRRGGGRRVTNTDISAEERRKLRVLKNRESAMRSLAKKAEHSAALATNEKQARMEFRSDHQKLQELVTEAQELKTALSRVPDDVVDLVGSVDACINKCITALGSEDPPDAANEPATKTEPSAEPPSQAPAS